MEKIAWDLRVRPLIGDGDAEGAQGEMSVANF